MITSQRRDPVTREEIYDTVQSLFVEKDLYAASEFVLGLPDESDVVQAFVDLVLDCYIGLTKILTGDVEAGEMEFGSAVSTLESRDGENAAFYAKQLLSVRAFFEKRVASDAEAGR